MVGAAMSEWELEGLKADRPAEELMPEADTPDGLPADELAYGVDDVTERGWISGSIGEKDRVGILCQQLGGGAGAGMERDARAASDEPRTIEALMPVSMTAIRGPAPSPWRVTAAA